MAAAAPAPVAVSLTAEKEKSVRRYDVDWLRVIGIIGLIFVHTATLFTADPLSPIHGRYNLVLAGFILFIHDWRLSLLFVVSGAGTFFALGFRRPDQFARERLKRILIPFIVGTLIVSPIQLYYGALRVPGYNRSYLQFYKAVMENLFLHGRFGSGAETLHWAHLWFLAYLLVFSFAALPLFLLFRTERGRRTVSRYTQFLKKTGGLFLLGIPIVIIEISLRPKYPGAFTFYNDLANVALFFTLFVYGFLIFSDEAIGKAIERHGNVSLALAAVMSAISMILVLSHHLPVRGYNLPYLLLVAMRGLNVWFGIIGFVSLGRKYLRFSNAFLTYATEVVYPIYVLHMPIVTMIASRVVKWNLHSTLQFAIILLGTFAGCLLIIELIIKQTTVTRILFGLKPKARNRLKKTQELNGLVQTEPS